MYNFATVSIDLDGIACYHAIHGLPAPSGSDPALDLGLPRFLEMMADLNLPATLFVIGRDLAGAELARNLRQAAESGHELANHSFSHDYRLIHASPETIAGEIRRAGRAIERISGEAPTGFRAPGYNISEAIMDALEDQGYRYDSSIFPAPAYFSLRAGAIAWYALRGKPSRSLPGDPRQFLASRGSYRPHQGALYRNGKGAKGRSLVELPIAALPWLRLPFIGTNLSLSPRRLNQALSQALRLSSAPINLELHAADFIDHSDGVDPALSQRQRDLSLAASTKIARLREVIASLAEHGQVISLASLAAQQAAKLK